MESYDHGKFISTVTWSKAFIKRRQYAGNKVLSRAPHYPARLYVYGRKKSFNDIWLNLFPKPTLSLLFKKKDGGRWAWKICELLSLSPSLSIYIYIVNLASGAICYACACFLDYYSINEFCSTKYFSAVVLGFHSLFRRKSKVRLATFKKMIILCIELRTRYLRILSWHMSWRR